MIQEAKDLDDKQINRLGLKSLAAIMLIMCRDLTDDQIIKINNRIKKLCQKGK